jgi:hypothetical protein
MFINPIVVLPDSTFNDLSHTETVAATVKKYEQKSEWQCAYSSSSGSFFRAFFTIHWKASSTFVPSLADVSKYGIFPFEAHHAFAFFSET